MPSYEETIQQPLTTDAQIEERVGALIGRAYSRQLWFMFLDDENVQLPLLIPLSGLPVGLPGIPTGPSPSSSGSFSGSLTNVMAEGSTNSDRCLGELVLLVDEAVERMGAAAVIVVIERYGDPSLTATDRAWAASIHDAFDAQGISLRGILLSHRRGVRWVAQDDYRF